MLAEWTTVISGATDAGGEFDFRGFHGSYDIILTPPGGQPTLRRIILDSGAGTNVVTLIAHPPGSRPLLHGAAISPASGQFQFQITGDAGRTYAVQTSTNLNSTNWTTLTNLLNPYGTISYTNPGAPSPSQLFFRARLLP